MNTIETKNYTKHYRSYSDNVTEYVYSCPKSLSVEAFNTLLEANNIVLEGGWVSFIKKQLRFKSGKVTFQHIAMLAVSVN